MKVQWPRSAALVLPGPPKGQDLRSTPLACTLVHHNAMKRESWISPQLKSAIGNILMKQASNYAQRKITGWVNRKRSSSRSVRAPTKRRARSRFYRVSKRGRRYKRMKRMINKCKDEGFGEYTWRSQLYTPLSLVSNNIAFDQFNTTLTTVNGRMSELKTYDPSTNSFIVTDYNALAKSTRPMVTVSVLYHMRNNSTTPAKVEWWICYPLTDTNQTPQSAMQDDVTDQVGNITFNAETFRIPYDLQFSRKFFTYSKPKSKILQPGESLNIKAVSKPFCFDPALFDSHTDNFQRKYKIPQILIRLKGVVSHNYAPGYVAGTGSVKLDAVKHTTIKVRYHSGVSVRYINSTNNSAPVGVGAVVANKPGTVLNTFADI